MAKHCFANLITGIDHRKVTAVFAFYELYPAHRKNFEKSLDQLRCSLYDFPLLNRRKFETTDPDVGQLRLFAVEKAHRRQGLGRRLIEALLKKARAAKYKKIILWTAAPLDSVLRQYERFGFRVTETSENQGWRTDGGKVTEIKMENLL